MNDYIIRPATAADAETIKRMVRSAPLNPNAIDWHYFLVLEIIEAGVKKIVSIGMVHPEGDIQEIDSIVTLPEYRRRGYAQAIVRALIASTPGALYLLAETALVPYYEKLGFQRLNTDQSPQAMTEQANWVNDFLKGRVTYHVMGKLD